MRPSFLNVTRVGELVTKGLRCLRRFLSDGDTSVSCATPDLFRAMLADAMSPVASRRSSVADVASPNALGTQKWVRFLLRERLTKV